MTLTPEQVKGRIKSLATRNNADARVMLRIYMMERFLERIAVSKYSENFIIKGGVLVTSMVGVAMRTTMDIDTTIRNLNLSEEDALEIVNEIVSIDLEDGVSFNVKDIGSIMDNMEYPGVRVTLDALMGKMMVPIKIDISTGDIITPRAIEYCYPLMLEERTINLWSYNLETILAEKLQTVLSRGILNTRTRDFYDIYTLSGMYRDRIDVEVLNRGFKATCEKRNSEKLLTDAHSIIDSIEADDTVKELWRSYQKKFAYAEDISFESVVNSIKELVDLATQLNLTNR